MHREPYILDISYDMENHTDENGGFSFTKEQRWKGKDRDISGYLEIICNKLEIITELLKKENGKG